MERNLTRESRGTIYRALQRENNLGAADCHPERSVKDLLSHSFSEQESIAAKATATDYFAGIRVLWLATHCHVPLRRIHVSVYRERITYFLPLFVPVSR